ncbi:zinc ribbon domain-containing protein [Isachenkonia alkalipeptolytica]|nr:zinc ribbon domain-containing protein [Isachenkonia alkalipeptolytica]
MFCTNCNNKVSVDDKFCNNCGSKLIEADENGSSEICPSCRTPNPKGSRYCVNCEDRISDTPATPKSGKGNEIGPDKEETHKTNSVRERKNYKVIIFWSLVALFIIGAPIDVKILISFLVCIIGGISILKPMRFIGINTRGKGVIIAGIGVVVLFVSAAQLPPDLATTHDMEISIADYKAQSNTIPYEDLIRETDKYVGEIVHYTGEVVEVQELRNNVYLRVNVTKGDFGFYTDTIWVNYIFEEGEKRIIEDDMVNLWGEIKGRKTYTAVLGNRITIPEINARKVELTSD